MTTHVGGEEGLYAEEGVKISPTRPLPPTLLTQLYRVKHGLSRASWDLGDDTSQNRCWRFDKIRPTVRSRCRHHRLSSLTREPPMVSLRSTPTHVWPDPRGPCADTMLTPNVYWLPGVCHFPPERRVLRCWVRVRRNHSLWVKRGSWRRELCKERHLFLLPPHSPPTQTPLPFQSPHLGVIYSQFADASLTPLGPDRRLGAWRETGTNWMP